MLSEIVNQAARRASQRRRLCRLHRTLSHGLAEKERVLIYPEPRAANRARGA